MLADLRRLTGKAHARLHRINESPRDERGASLAEYALLLALIAVVSIGSLVLLGQSTTRALTLTSVKMGAAGGTGVLPGGTVGDLGAPSNLAANPGPGAKQIALSWDAPTSNNSGYSIIGYDVFEGTSAGAESATPVDDPTGTSDTIPGLTNGTQYFFEVEAVIAIGNSAPSNEASAKTFDVPAAPTLAAPTPGYQQVALSWTANGNGGTPITGFNVYVGTSAGHESTTPSNASPLSSTATTYTVTGLANNTPYFIEIEAVNLVGSSLPSNEVSATTANVPGAPTGLTAAAADGEVDLTWTAPASNGGSPITLYDIYEARAANGENYATPTATSAGLSAAITGLTNNTKYYFTVEAVNAVGNSAHSNEASATPQFGVPSAPTGLTATPGNDQVTLSWTAPANGGGCGFYAYEVFDGTTSPPTTFVGYVGIFNPGTTTDTITGLTDGQVYYFDVETISLCLETSAPSNVASATPAVTVPDAPFITTATGGYEQVTLSWTTPNDGGSPITGYAVYEGTTAGGENYTTPATTTAVGTNTATITGLTDGTRYYFTVKAINAKGDSVPSNEANATPAPTAPAAPTALTATPGNGQVVLNWTAPTYTGGDPITGYDVYQGNRAGGEGRNPVATVGPNTTTATIASLTNGNTYYFVVEAVNLVGNSVPSNEANATPTGPPSAPRNLAAASGNTQITLTWNTPVNNGGSPITGYDVYESATAGGENYANPPVATTTFGTNTVVITGLTDGTGYYFTVEAVNAAGNSVPSNEAHATPAPTAPAAPTALIATPGNQKVVLNWTAPTNNGGDPITGYDVYQGNFPGGEGNTPVATVGPNTTTATIAGLTGGNTYYFVVEAVNLVGNSAPSNEANATPTGPPGAPRNFAAASGNAQITLTWNAPFNNGGSPITGYDIYESTTAGGENYASPTTTTGAGANTATISGLTNGNTYYFTIEAVNALGNSVPSGETRATPATLPGAPTGVTPTVPRNGQVTLNWTAPGSNGGSVIQGYDVYVSRTPGGENYGNPVNFNLIGGTTYTVTGLTHGTKYYFTVEAVNAVGNSAPSTETSQTP